MIQIGSFPTVPKDHTSKSTTAKKQEHQTSWDQGSLCWNSLHGILGVDATKITVFAAHSSSGNIYHVRTLPSPAVAVCWLTPSLSSTSWMYESPLYCVADRNGYISVWSCEQSCEDENVLQLRDACKCSLKLSIDNPTPRKVAHFSAKVVSLSCTQRPVERTERLIWALCHDGFLFQLQFSLQVTSIDPENVPADTPALVPTLSLARTIDLRNQSTRSNRMYSLVHAPTVVGAGGVSFALGAQEGVSLSPPTKKYQQLDPTSVIPKGKVFPPVDNADGEEELRSAFFHPFHSQLLYIATRRTVALYDDTLERPLIPAVAWQTRPGAEFVTIFPPPTTSLELLSFSCHDEKISGLEARNQNVHPTPPVHTSDDDDDLLESEDSFSADDYDTKGGDALSLLFFSWDSDDALTAWYGSQRLAPTCETCVENFEAFSIGLCGPLRATKYPILQVVQHGNFPGQNEYKFCALNCCGITIWKFWPVQKVWTQQISTPFSQSASRVFGLVSHSKLISGTTKEESCEPVQLFALEQPSSGPGAVVLQRRRISNLQPTTTVNLTAAAKVDGIVADPNLPERIWIVATRTGSSGQFYTQIIVFDTSICDTTEVIRSRPQTPDTSAVRHCEARVEVSGSESRKEGMLLLSFMAGNWEIWSMCDAALVRSEVGHGLQFCLWGPRGIVACPSWPTSRVLTFFHDTGYCTFAVVTKTSVRVLSELQLRRPGGGEVAVTKVACVNDMLVCADATNTLHVLLPTTEGFNAKTTKMHSRSGAIVTMSPCPFSESCRVMAIVTEDGHVSLLDVISNQLSKLTWSGPSLVSDVTWIGPNYVVLVANNGALHTVEVTKPESLNFLPPFGSFGLAFSSLTPDWSLRQYAALGEQTDAPPSTILRKALRIAKRCCSPSQVQLWSSIAVLLIQNGVTLPSSLAASLAWSPTTLALLPPTTLISLRTRLVKFQTDSLATSFVTPLQFRLSVARRWLRLGMNKEACHVLLAHQPKSGMAARSSSWLDLSGSVSSSSPAKEPSSDSAALSSEELSFGATLACQFAAATGEVSPLQREVSRIAALTLASSGDVELAVDLLSSVGEHSDAARLLLYGNFPGEAATQRAAPQPMSAVIYAKCCSTTDVVQTIMLEAATLCSQRGDWLSATLLQISSFAGSHDVEAFQWKVPVEMENILKTLCSFFPKNK